MLRILASFLILLPSVSSAGDPPREPLTAAQVSLLPKGMSALDWRLAKIEDAEESIELEVYIFHFDESGQALAQALMKKAKEGKAVRLLVDRMGLDSESKAYLDEMAHAGVEIRIFNNSSILRAVQVQFRNHQKLLIVDGKTAITGGRNVGDEYFGRGDEFNFVDTDAIVQGPVVEEMRASFDHYWDAKIVTRYDPKKGMKRRAKRDEAARRVPVTWLPSALPDVDEAPTAQEHPCREATYVSDVPNPVGKGAGKRVVREALKEFVESCSGSTLWIDSAYFINSRNDWPILRKFLNEGGTLKIHTNSMRASDVPLVAVRFDQQKSKLLANGAEIYLHDGEYDPELSDAADAQAEETPWGSHSKLMVCEGRTSRRSRISIEWSCSGKATTCTSPPKRRMRYFEQEINDSISSSRI